MLLSKMCVCVCVCVCVYVKCFLLSEHLHTHKNGMAVPPLFLPGEFQGQRNLAGYEGVTKSWTQLSD